MGLAGGSRKHVAWALQAHKMGLPRSLYLGYFPYLKFSGSPGAGRVFVNGDVTHSLPLSLSLSQARKMGLLDVALRF